MNGRQNEQAASDFHAVCTRVFHEWHERARARDTEGLLALYSEDAILESPLVPAILDDKQDGVLRGREELRRFFEDGGRRRPNELVRWYRTGEWLTDGRRLLVWEYPRQAPDGDQVDLVEFMEIAGGLIAYHRVYWGVERLPVDSIRAFPGLTLNHSSRIGARGPACRRPVAAFGTPAFTIRWLRHPKRNSRRNRVIPAGRGRSPLPPFQHGQSRPHQPQRCAQNDLRRIQRPA